MRELFDNAWLRLFALDGKGRMSQPYGGDLQWQPALGEVASAPAPDSAQPANKPFRPGVPGVC